MFCAMQGPMRIFTKGCSTYSREVRLAEKINMYTGNLNTKQHPISDLIEIEYSAVGPRGGRDDSRPEFFSGMYINTNFWFFAFT